VIPKEIPMFRSCTLSLAAAALLVTLSGCNAEAMDVEALRPVTAAMETPPVGHELHRMFQAEKANAPFSELPAQF
jgi:hypothetical protein